MKRGILGLLLVAGLTFGVMADGIFDAEIGLRSIGGAGPIPSLGLSLGRDSELVLDIYKKDFWALEWPGMYAVDFYASVRALTWLYATVGVQKPIEVDVAPLMFPDTPLYLTVGLSFYAGYPADLFVRALFEGATFEAIEFGLHIGLAETIGRLFGTASVE